MSLSDEMLFDVWLNFFCKLFLKEPNLQLKDNYLFVESTKYYGK